MSYPKPSGPVILLPTTAEGARQLPRMREVFAALASIRPETPFTCSRKNKEGNQRIQWKSAGITITGIVLPNCVNLTILEIEHKSDAKPFNIRPWKYHHTAIDLKSPYEGVAEFLKDHAPLSCEAASLLSEGGPSSVLSRLITNALAAHGASEFEKRAAQYKKNGAPASFSLDTDPIFSRISGNPQDIDDDLIPQIILDLPPFARCSYIPGDSISAPEFALMTDIIFPYRESDPVDILSDISLLHQLLALLKADRR